MTGWVLEREERPYVWARPPSGGAPMRMLRETWVALDVPPACEAVLHRGDGVERCTLDAGHGGVHDSGYTTWTVQGVEVPRRYDGFVVDLAGVFILGPLVLWVAWLVLYLVWGAR